MSTKKMIRYQCGQSQGKSTIIKVPEDIKLECKGANSWIVKPSTICKVNCAQGTPNYEYVTCKANGWRQSNNIKCEGASAGVIIGALIGGLAGVVLIAIIYAKYHQHKKARLGKQTTSSIRAAKLKNQAANRRPGKIIGEDTSKPTSLYYDGPDRKLHFQGGRNSRESGTTRSNSSLYAGSASYPNGGRSSRRQSYDGRSINPYEQRDMDYSTSDSLPQGYYGVDYHGNMLEDPTFTPNSQIYDSYYHGHAPSYNSPEPAIGYGSYIQPGAHQSVTDYYRPYQVQT